MLIVSSSYAGGIILALASALALVGCGGKVVVDGIASSGGGGSSGSAAGGSGGASANVCTPHQVSLLGSIDSVPIDVTVPFFHGGGTLQNTLDAPGVITSADENDGHLIFMYSTCSHVNDVVTCPTDLGMFRVPFVPPVPGEPPVPNQGLWICNATGPTVTYTAQESKPVEEQVRGPVSFASLRRLGACPGVPVSGQLTQCENDNFCGKESITGTVDGHPVDGAFVSGMYSDGTALETVFEGRGILLSGPGHEPSVFLMPDGSGDAGAIYCIGSTETDPVTGKLVMGNLSRLGTCAEAEPIAGSVTACLGF